MKKQVKFLTALVLLLTLVVSQVAFAIPDHAKGKGNDKEVVRGYEKNLKNFEMIDGERVRVNSKHIKFDVPPVIKEGRTLIPIRAITEAMGASVVWDPETQIVTITSPDGLIIIKFYLAEEDEGKITVEKDGVVEDVTIDVRPGLINNRTFVPLRFIAETLGLRVGYKDGQIEIDNGPILNPDEVEYEVMADVPETIDVTITLNEFEFTGITGLTEGQDYTTTTNGAFMVMIEKDYVLGLTDEETELEFTFEKDLATASREFEIKLKYNDEEMMMPYLDPEEIKFEDMDDIPAAIPVEVIENDYSFTGIAGLTEGDEYEVTSGSGLMVIFNDDYVKGLAVEETKLLFLFEKDGNVIDVEFEIELSYLDEEPSITPDEVTYIDGDLVVDLDFNGYSLVAISDGSALVAGVDYDLDGDDVTLYESYLEDIIADELELSFILQKGADIETLILTINF